VGVVPVYTNKHSSGIIATKFKGLRQKHVHRIQQQLRTPVQGTAHGSALRTLRVANDNNAGHWRRHQDEEEKKEEQQQKA